MAEMYSEVGSRWLLSETEDGWEGTRVFIRDDNNGAIAAASLPVRGTTVMKAADGTTDVPGCICRTKRITYEGGHVGSAVVECTFSTKSVSSRRSGDSVPDDYQAATFDFGVGLDTVKPDPNPPGGDYWTWGSSEEVEQDLPITIPDGRVEITFPFEVAASLRDQLLARVKEYRGTLNNATFWGHDAGQVMFMGISGGGTYRDATNAVVYRVSFLFQFRTLPTTLKDSGADTKDWLYVFSAKHGKYKKPVTNVGGKYLYEEKNFATLLSEVTAPP